MKRYGKLYPQICSFENLVAAAYRARRGKRRRPDVLAFHFQQERLLLELHDELLEKRYEPGPYRSFWIRDPKQRLISAAPYRDRIVHHALCQVIEPLFERGFIHASYANRVGKGTHAALDHATRLARRYPWVLKCDIEKYFPSIDHAILMERLGRKIKCRDTLWLIERIVANSNPQEEVLRYFPGDGLFTPLERRRGLPIGNLTSQFFANVYLDGFDHFCQERLGCRAYLRFADDFLVFGPDKRVLGALPARMQERLDGLRLMLNPRKCQVLPVRDGVPFLGWQLYPDHRRLRRATGVRIERRLKELARKQREGAIGLGRVRASLMSWIGHLKHGDTWGLRRRLFAAAVFGPPRRASE
jgi:retron-type reverse transcriptase